MIEKIKIIRNSLLGMINDLSIEELNEIPAGFNNNIIWNLAHLTAAQQGMCYVRAGVPTSVSEEFIAPFRSGTKPEKFVDEDQAKTLKDILLSSLDQFETDRHNNLFDKYSAWKTRMGVEINNIDDALEFMLFHEGLHLGCIQSIKKIIKNKDL